MLRVATNPALTERERIPTRVFSEPQDMNRAVAAEIAALVRQKAVGRRALCARASRPAPARSASTTSWCGCTRRGTLVSQRRHVQPRRVLPDAADGAAELPSLHARAPVRPHRHPARERAHPRRHAAAEAGPATYCQRYEAADRRRPAGSTCSSSASAARATSASTSRAPAAKAARA